MGPDCEHIVRSIFQFHLQQAPFYSERLSRTYFGRCVSSDLDNLTYGEYHFFCNDCALDRRNTARLAVSCFSPSAARLAALLIVSYAYTLAQRLQQRRADEPSKSLLAEQSPRFSARVTGSTNKPLECLVILGEVVRVELNKSELSPDSLSSNVLAERTALETCIGELIDHLGACERLCTCHVPLSYSRHTTRLLSLFLISLPLVLVGQPGGRIYTIPFVVFVTWALSGIDEVAHLIEDCFAGQPYSLALDPLCDKIRRDILEQVVPLNAPVKASSHLLQ